MTHPSANPSEELVPESAPVLGPAVSSSAGGGPSPLGALDEPLAPFRPGAPEPAPAEAPAEAPPAIDPGASLEWPLQEEVAAPTDEAVEAAAPTDGFDEPVEAVLPADAFEPQLLELPPVEEEVPAAGDPWMPWELPAPSGSSAPEPVAMDALDEVDDEFPVFPAAFEPVEAAEPEVAEPEVAASAAPVADDEELPFEHDVPVPPAPATREDGWDIESELGFEEEAGTQAEYGAWAEPEDPWTAPPAPEERGEGPVALGGAAVDGPAAAPALRAVADRLERIARSLRERTADDLLAGGDPLEILIAGYALGYADALRRSPGERPPLD